MEVVAEGSVAKSDTEAKVNPEPAQSQQALYSSGGANQAYGETEDTAARLEALINEVAQMEAALEIPSHQPVLQAVSVLPASATSAFSPPPPHLTSPVPASSDDGSSTPRPVKRGRSTVNIPWTPEEEEVLLSERNADLPMSFTEILNKHRDKFHPSRSDQALLKHYGRLMKNNPNAKKRVKSHLWTPEEDAIILKGLSEGLSFPAILDHYKGQLHPSRTVKAMRQHHHMMSHGKFTDITSPARMAGGKTSRRRISNAAMIGVKREHDTDSELEAAESLERVSVNPALQTFHAWSDHYELDGFIREALINSGFGTTANMETFEANDLDALDLSLGFKKKLQRARAGLADGSWNAIAKALKD